MSESRNIYIPIIIVNCIIILISLYLTFLFIKSKSFKTYPCYNMIIFSFIILIDNILRIIPINDNKDCNTFEDIEAFFLVFLDKLILATLSMQALIYYLGVIKSKFYSENEKRIFFITLSFSLIISATIAGIYIIFFGTTPYGWYCYCKDPTNKKIIDTIFNGVYLTINFYCTLVLLIYVWIKEVETPKGAIKDYYNHNLKRILIMFFLNNITFVESYFIIYDVFKDFEYTDLVYLITCLAIDLYNSLNETVYKETLKIFCKNIYNKKYKKIKSTKTRFDDDDEDDDSNPPNEQELKEQRTESFD